MIDFGDLTLAPGGTGYVDVAVSGTGGGQALDTYVFEYQITKTSGVGRLEFVSSQPSYLTNSDYVFFGNSWDHENSVPVGSVSTNLVPNDTFIGTDNTNDGSNVTVTGSKLLSRLWVTANTALAPQDGDVYSIALVPSTTSFSYSSGSSINYTSDTGTVTISSAVPEPGSLVALLSGGACLAGLTWRRSRRRRVAAG